MTGQPPPERVRVTAPRGRRTPPRRTLLRPGTEIDAETEVGLIFVRSLLRAQLRLVVGLLALVAVLLGGLPLALLAVPALVRTELAGMPAAWGVLGALVYPVLVLVGAGYVRAAERIERAFTDVTGPASGEAE